MKLAEGVKMKLSCIRVMQEKAESVTVDIDNLSKGLSLLPYSDVIRINHDYFKSMEVTRGKYYNPIELRDRVCSKLNELTELKSMLDQSITEQRNDLLNELILDYSEDGTRVQLTEKLNKIGQLNNEIGYLRRFYETAPYDMKIRIPDSIRPYLQPSINVINMNGHLVANSSVLKKLASEVISRFEHEVSVLRKEADGCREIINLFVELKGDLDLEDDDDEVLYVVDLPYIPEELEVEKDIAQTEALYDAIHIVRKIYF